MFRFFKIALGKMQRDRNMSVRVLIDKSLSYALSTLSSPLHLHAANHVGRRVRTLVWVRRGGTYGTISGCVARAFGRQSSPLGVIW